MGETMKSSPRMSIVIPNYNSGSVLERAIRSILDQDYPSLQLIMADGGSTDASRGVIETYRDEFDTVISEADEGQAHALNKGFRCADGEIHGWLCADDELLPGALDEVARVFEAHPDAAIVTGRCERIYPEGEVFITPADPDAWAVIGIQNVIDQPSTYWKAAVHRRVGQLVTSYWLGFDWDLWVRIRDSGGRLITTDRVLSRYYFSDGNKCGTAGNIFADEAYRLIRQYGPGKGLLARVYRFIYRHFDLKGCLDDPPTSSRIRYAMFLATMGFFHVMMGRDLMSRYNWHFASLQERGLRWW